MKYTEQSDDFYQWNYEQAKLGKPSRALELLHGLLAHYDAGLTVPSPIMDFLAAGIREYLHSEVPLERALHLTKLPNRPKGSLTTDSLRVAAAVLLLVERDRLGKDAAKMKIGELLGVTKRNAERCLSYWMEPLSEFSIEELASIANLPDASAK